MSKPRFDKLLEPNNIGLVRVRNRIIKTGANPGFYPYEDGHVQQPIVDYYDAVAAGGAGLIIVGSGEIDWPIGTVPNVGYRMDEERYIPGLKKVADAIRKHGCPAFIQLLHMGPRHPQALTGFQPISASSLPQDQIPQPDCSVAREMTLQDIVRVKGRFVNAALIAQKAGFQGVEINAATYQLLNSFLSRAWNRRKDAYGCGSPENRARIVVELIQEIKSAAGKDFAVAVLWNGMESGLANGITVDDSRTFARMFEKAGADVLQARVEFYNRPIDPSKRDTTHFPDMLEFVNSLLGLDKEIDMSLHGRGGWVRIAAEIKKVVSVPVMAVGRLDPDLSEQILRQGKADLVGFNRRLMADHELPNKLIAGNAEDIAPCTACLTCYDQTKSLKPPRCRINAAFGKEKECEIRPAAQRKTVMVVGGGPAGMEAARIAALRGHKVSLYERLGKLGGSMRVAAVVKGPERENFLEIVRYLDGQMTKLGVKVTLGREVTPDLVEKIKPDVLVLAAGAKHNIPNVPGINSRKVLTSERLHGRVKLLLGVFGPTLLRSLTKIYVPLGRNVVVLGGGVHGCQTAEFLVKRGRRVTIVDTCTEALIGYGLVEQVKQWLLNWLKANGVNFIPEATWEEVTAEGVVLSAASGARHTVKADTVVTALPLKPNTEFFERMKSKAPEVYVIGDAREPNFVVDAIEDGMRTGLRI